MKVREPIVLALDVGTSSVRATLFDALARPLEGSETKLEYSPRVGADGSAEVGAEQLAGLVEHAIDRTLGGRGAPAEVAAVGLSTFWHGLLGLDGRHRPTTPVILWSDTRSWRQAERLRADLDGEALRRRTGCPVHPMYWPAKLLWLRETDRDTFARTRHWASIGELLYRRLLGALGTSASMASGTGLRRLAGGWDEELLGRTGVAARCLPPEVGEMAELRPDLARRWPRLKGAVWVPAAGDGALANYGSGCLDPGQRALTVGTSGALRVITEARPRHPAPGLWCYLLDERRYVVGGSLSNGGNLWAWMRRVLRVEEQGLDRRLGRIGPASTGLDFLPLLAGERSPGFASHATGAVSGLTQATTAEQLIRAGLEAVALRFALLDAALDRTVPGAKRLVASGGALHASPAWAQIMADAIGKPVALSRAFEASSQGAAELALERVGVRRPPRTRVGRTFEPREEARSAYLAAGRRQAELYRKLIQGRT